MRKITNRMSRMWMKNTVTWKAKKPKSHPSSSNNAIARNIYRPLFPALNWRPVKSDGKHG